MLNLLLSLFKAKSLSHLLKIWLVFALAGSASLMVSRHIVTLFFDLENDQIYSSLAQILFIVSTYYALLLLVGACLGEGRYFAKMAKKSLGRPLNFLKYLVGFGK